jgi:zinc and cadmium transporter
METLLPLLGLATIGSVLALVGGVVFLLASPLKNFLCKFSVPFAAGILLTVAILDLVPEAVEHSGEIAFLFILVAFLMVFAFEHLFFNVHHHEGHTHEVTPGAIPLVIAGDSIHNFIDGVAIAAAYMVDPAFGLIVAISSFLHEVPHEIGDFGVLLSAGWRRSAVFLVNLLSSATTFAGVLFVYFFAHNDFIIGILLSISAGLFLYLGASDFLPGRNDHSESSIGKVLTVIIAATIMILVSLVLPHAHQ